MCWYSRRPITSEEPVGTGFPSFSQLLEPSLSPHCARCRGSVVKGSAKRLTFCGSYLTQTRWTCKPPGTGKINRPHLGRGSITLHTLELRWQTVSPPLEIVRHFPHNDVGYLQTLYLASGVYANLVNFRQSIPVTVELPIPVTVELPIPQKRSSC